MIYLSVCVSVCLCVYIDSCNYCVSSVWRENLYSDVLLKAPDACEKVLRTFVFSSRFSKKHVFSQIFYAFLKCVFFKNIITLLFVTLSHMIGFSSKFCSRRKKQLLYRISTFKCAMTPLPRIVLFENMKFQLDPHV